MKRGGFSIVCGAIILLGLGTVAMAQDEGRAVHYAASSPAFDLPHSMSVERYEVHVSLSSVRLLYVFKSPTRQTVHFSFAMPDMPVDASPEAIGVRNSRDGLIADTQPLNYLDLSVRVNDRSLTLAGVGRALLDGQDVTRQLRDAGVPLLYDLYGEAPWLHLPLEVKTSLEVSGLLDGGAALWSYQASFAWDQVFEPGETHIEISYAPVLDYWSDITLDAFPQIAPEGSASRAYCIDDALRRAFFSKPSYELYTVTQLAAPPQGWHGSVGAYRLVVDKGDVANLVAFCPLAAKKTSPTTFEWRAENVVPDSEIGVLFFVDPDAGE